MKIAVTVDPYVAIPPRHYGGIERVVDFLVKGLLARGHEVTLFAHPDSDTESTLVPYGVPPHVGPRARAQELWQVGAKLFAMRRSIDFVHSFGRLAALSPILPVRSLAKLQTYQRDVLPRKGIARAVALAGESLEFTACATHMFAGESLAGRWTTVYNGVALDKYCATSKVPPDAPLVFLGRVERIKGVHNAIAIAKGARRRLEIAGNVSDPAYFEDVIAPQLDGDTIRYVGPVDDEQKNRLLGRAAALLMAIEWDEPFGIVMVEAMACGTPVIGFSRGSVPEVVRDGVSGFVVADVDGAVRAVEKVPTLARAAVRRDAEERFAADVIVSDYVRVYERLVGCLR
jgi:glycosyltransferase involved in cell wall biosynthesis